MMVGLLHARGGRSNRAQEAATCRVALGAHAARPPRTSLHARQSPSVERASVRAQRVGISSGCTRLRPRLAPVLQGVLREAPRVRALATCGMPSGLGAYRRVLRALARAARAGRGRRSTHSDPSAIHCIAGARVWVCAIRAISLQCFSFAAAAHRFARPIHSCNTWVAGPRCTRAARDRRRPETRRYEASAFVVFSGVPSGTPATDCRGRGVGGVQRATGDR
jgi:hypothetical protein